MAKQKWLIVLIVFLFLGCCFTFVFWDYFGEPISLMLAHNERGTVGSIAEIPYVTPYIAKELADFPVEGEIRYSLYHGFLRTGVQIFFSTTSSLEKIERYCMEHDWLISTAHPDTWNKKVKYHNLSPKDFPIVESAKDSVISKSLVVNGAVSFINISYRQKDGRITGEIKIQRHYR